MSTSRSESQTPQFGRRRSNTAQSIYKTQPLSATPLKIGDSKTLITWVHDVKDSPNVTLNQAWWSGVAEGDMLRLSANPSDNASGFLFIFQRDEGSVRHQLQVSSPSHAPMRHSERRMISVGPVCARYLCRSPSRRNLASETTAK